MTYRQKTIVGAVLLIFGYVGLTASVDSARGWWMLAPVAGGAVCLSGLVLLLVGCRQESLDVRRRKAERNFSWCPSCGYPFSETIQDDQMLTCPECGKVFTALRARRHYGHKPADARGRR